MKTKIAILLLFILLSVAVTLPPDCTLSDKIDGVDPLVTWSGDACAVVIKAATDEMWYTADGCTAGYCVEGFGTDTITAERTCDNAHGECHKISHVDIYTIQDPTSVSFKSFSADRRDIKMDWFVLGMITGIVFYGLFQVIKAVLANKKDK